MSGSPPSPAGNAQSVGFFIALLLFAIIGGDYYTLMNKEVIAEARTQQLMQAQAALVAGQRTTPGVAVPSPAPVPQPPAETAKGAAGLASAGDRLKSKVLVGAARFYERGGIWVRVLVLLGAVVLVFVQKTPKDLPGKPKMKPIDPKAVRVVAWLCGGVFLIAGYVLLTVHSYAPGFIEVGYPSAALAALSCGGLVGFLWASTKQERFGLTTERKKTETPDGLVFSTEDGGWISVPNPYRGILVLGGAGAGKTYSIGEPMVEQFAAKNYAGLIYDFKFPVLAGVAQKALVLAEQKKLAEQAAKEKYAKSWQGRLNGWLRQQEPAKEELPVEYHIINFRDLTRTERVNPFKASDMPVVAYASEYCKSLINNLDPSTIKSPNSFFSTSAIAYLTSITWFYRTHFPQYCTIPHVIATALHPNYEHVLSMLQTDLQSGDLVMSLISAVQAKAGKQIAGVVATLQNIMAPVNSPEIAWVLTPNEANGEGFSLNLNDPKRPKLLCIGNDPTLSETFAPIIGAIITVCLKQMNQQDKHRSYVFLDEAATIYIPNLDRLPATARSNRVCLAFMTQGFPQMVDMYGKDKMNVLVDNLNTQFFGKTNSVDTAKFISELVGREDREMMSTSTGSSTGGSGNRNRSTNQSMSYQERHLVRIQDSVKLKQGEFIGQTVETEQTFFQGKIVRPDSSQDKYPIHPIAFFGDEGEDSEKVLKELVLENFLTVRRQVNETLNKHVNIFAVEGE